MERKILTITGIGGIIAAIIGLIGLIFCCSVLPILIFGAGITALIVQNSGLILGIGIGLILCSALTFLFGSKTCKIK